MKLYDFERFIYHQKFIFAIVRRPFFPHLLENRHLLVAVIINDLRPALTADPADVLGEFSMERNGEDEKKNVEVRDVGAFAEDLASGDKDLEPPAFDPL